MSERTLKPMMSSEEVNAEIERLDAEGRALEEAIREDQGLQSEVPAPSTSSLRPGEAELGESTSARQKLMQTYEQLEGDERFTDEHRAQAAWEAYDKHKAVIETQGRAAREKMLRAADALERKSIPFPTGQGVRTRDVSLLSLTQGERARITERLEHQNATIARMQAAGKNTPSFAEDRPRKILHDEYARGLDTGGPLGGAICRAVIQLATDRGHDVDTIVDEHRKEWERDYLAEAHQTVRQANAVWTKVPMPPYKRPGGPRSPEEAGSRRRSALGLPRKGHTSSGPLFPKQRRRPSWK
jgi:hypothetical protein